MVRYFLTLGFRPVLGEGFKVQNFVKKEKGTGPVLYGFSVLKVFWGVGVGHVYSCRGGSCTSVFS
jgi:ferredoxin